MAWTTPSTRAHGFRVTHTVWNDQVVNDLLYLYSRLRLDMSTRTTVNNSVTETTIAQIEVSEGMGINDGVFFVFQFDWLNNTVANHNTRFRFKFGTTTVIDSGNIQINASGDRRRGVMLGFLTNNGATNAQNLQVETFFRAGAAAWTAVNASSYSAGGTATEDTTSAKYLTITVQHDFASTDLTITGQMLLVGPAIS